MFGKRSGSENDTRPAKPGASVPEPAAPAAPAAPPRAAAPPVVSAPPLAPVRAPPPPPAEARRSDNYYQVKATIFGALIEAIDLAQLSKLDGEIRARGNPHDIVNEIIAIKNIVMSKSRSRVPCSTTFCNDVLGYGPLEPLLARGDIADIMVNGAGTVFIDKSRARFRHPASASATTSSFPQHLPAHRQPGRPARRRMPSPICDALLADGSRVNAIVPPPGDRRPALTIRKFKKDKLTLDQLVPREFGAISPEGAEILQIIGPRPPLQRADLRRYRLGQDHAAQLPHQTIFEHDERVDSLRRRRRIATAAAAWWCGPGNPPSQHRGRRPGHHARAGAP